MGFGGIFLAIVCAVIEFIIFLFTIVATPIDAWRAKAKVSSPFFGSYRICYSMWGIKRCGNHKVDTSGVLYKGFGCKKTRDTMNAAAAFSIFSIFITLVCFVFCLLAVLKVFGGGLIPAILGIVAFVTLLITWACIAGALHQKCDGVVKHSSAYKYGASFGLLVTAWCLQIINCVLLFLI